MFFKFLSCLLIFGSAFSNSLMDQFKKEVLCWPKKGPVANKFYKKAKQLKNISSKPKIPKIIHQIWLGSEIPEKFYEAMQSWKNHHPDWDYRLWTDKDVKLFKMQNFDLFSIAPNYGMKSDLLRMEILDRYGGLYVDVDQYCLKPHDIFHHLCSFYLGTINQIGYCNNNLIGVSKGNSFIKNWVKTVRENFVKRHFIDKKAFSEEFQTTLELTGPVFLNEKIKESNFKDCLILEKFFFNPLQVVSRENIDLASISKRFKPYTYSVHFHTTTWVEK